jgi:hypothetical protein
MKSTRSNGSAEAVNGGTALYALDLDRGHMVMFSASPPPPEVRDDLLTNYRGRFLEGVSLEIPDDLDDRPEGAEYPDGVLCVEEANPQHFRVFKYEREIRGSGFLPTGKGYSVMRDRRQWRRFMDSLRRLNAIASMTDESDTPETWATVKRLLDRGRTDQPDPADRSV